MFVLKLFKMEANQVQDSKLEKKSVINFGGAEKCKPYEIYKRMGFFRNMF